MSSSSLSRIVDQFAYLDNFYMLTVEAMNHFGTLFAVKISPGKQDKYHLVAIKTTSLQHFSHFLLIPNLSLLSFKFAKFNCNLCRYCITPSMAPLHYWSTWEFGEHFVSDAILLGGKHSKNLGKCMGKEGSEIATSWLQMWLKIECWWPEFWGWSPLAD